MALRKPIAAVIDTVDKRAQFVPVAAGRRLDD